MSRDSRSVLTRSAPPPSFTVTYGEHPDHTVDVWLPAGSQPTLLVLLIHGGFWRHAYDRTHIAPLASALAAAGYLVATPEYRRTGAPAGDGGWPGTFDDTAAVAGRVPALVAERIGQQSIEVILSGHSAGGHLALWAAATMATRPAGVVALAPVADLRACFELDLDRGAVTDLLGGSPAMVPDRYQAADPLALVPLGCPTSVVHGTRDAQVPVAFSRRFVEAALNAGDPAGLWTPDVNHFDVIDPCSPAWPVILTAFGEVAPPPR